MPFRDHVGESWHATARAEKQPTASSGRLGVNLRSCRVDRVERRSRAVALMGIAARSVDQPADARTDQILRSVTSLALGHDQGLGGDVAATVTP